MDEWQFKQMYAFGFIIFAALLFWAVPGWVEPVGWATALFICWYQAYRHWPTEITVARERWKIDREHEAL